MDGNLSAAVKSLPQSSIEREIIQNLLQNMKWNSSICFAFQYLFLVVAKYSNNTNDVTRIIITQMEGNGVIIFIHVSS